jgi:hypothetical protein
MLSSFSQIIKNFNSTSQQNMKLRWDRKTHTFTNKARPCIFLWVKGSGLELSSDTALWCGDVSLSWAYIRKRSPLLVPRIWQLQIKRTPCLLLRKRTVSTERLPWSGEVNLFLFICRIWCFTAVPMMHIAFWDVPPCGCCKNRRFGGRCSLYHQGESNQGAGNKVSSKECRLLGCYAVWLL